MMHRTSRKPLITALVAGLIMFAAGPAVFANGGSTQPVDVQGVTVSGAQVDVQLHNPNPSPVQVSLEMTVLLVDGSLVQVSQPLTIGARATAMSSFQFSSAVSEVGTLGITETGAPF